eukprot:NODE_220_length_2656_cov_38.353895_g205_i0.p1 GENE.NODE_220_length_2656_cov_38.353895_g205_i0~~NODE_220_length_2656_cov_38.353895_g205_i0.p1  ORF type:complete len:863 (+),score=259.85 NODE_220_length_2656_cov_38.353895_g205_i0:234-2591(+)
MQCGQAPSLCPLSVVLLGGCFASVSGRYLPSIGRSLGYDVECRSDWIENIDALRTKQTDIVVLQAGTGFVLDRLLQVSFTAEERRAGCTAAKELMRQSIHKCLSILPPTTLLLAQGVSLPFLSPNGKSAYRRPEEPLALLAELNQFLRETVQPVPNAMFVDEDLLFSAHGKTLLMDDIIAPFFHHAPIELVCGVGSCELKRQEAFKYPGNYYSVRLLCREYLDCYTVWKARAPIKCIVVDLDGTLWPGTVGDTDFVNLNVTDGFQTFKFGTFGGLHEALTLMKQRGILLATCSKGTYEHTMEAWQKIYSIASNDGLNHILGPDAFVLHRINWSAKPENIRDIALALNIGLDSILFIDDNPIEREAVQLAIPEVRILGESIEMVRSILLSSPFVQSLRATEEASMRTELAKAQLTREVHRTEYSGSEQQFLQSMSIVMEITRVTVVTDIGRIFELFTRTNQFRTTTIPYTEAELQEVAEDPSKALFALRVSDKFASYGLVGALLVADNNIGCLALSCRVLGLQISVPFVTLALTLLDAHTCTATLVKSNRNVPCHSIFEKCGFVAETDQLWRLPSIESLPPVDFGVYTVKVLREVRVVGSYAQVGVVDKGVISKWATFRQLDTSSNRHIAYQVHRNVVVFPSLLSLAHCTHLLGLTSDGAADRITITDTSPTMRSIQSIVCCSVGLRRTPPPSFQLFRHSAALSEPHIDACSATVVVYLQTQQCACDGKNCAGSFIFPVVGLVLPPVSGDAIKITNRNGDARCDAAAHFLKPPCCHPHWFLGVYFQ